MNASPYQYNFTPPLNLVPLQPNEFVSESRMNTRRFYHNNEQSKSTPPRPPPPPTFTQLPPQPPPQAYGIYTIPNEIQHPNAFQLQQQFKLPASFNPRTSPNMSHREKVDRWIKEVPVWFLARDEDGIELWHSECYPAVIPVTSGSNSIDIDESGMLFVENEDVLEFQARRITEFVRRLYFLQDRLLELHLIEGESEYDDQLPLEQDFFDN